LLTNSGNSTAENPKSDNFLPLNEIFPGRGGRGAACGCMLALSRPAADESFYCAAESALPV
jgi:hypothetical protein